MGAGSVLFEKKQGHPAEPIPVCQASKNERKSRRARITWAEDDTGCALDKIGRDGFGLVEVAGDPLHVAESAVLRGVRVAR